VGGAFVLVYEAVEDAGEVAAQNAAPDPRLAEIGQLRDENSALAGRLALLEKAARVPTVVTPAAPSDTPAPGASADEILARAREAAREEARTLVEEAAKQAGALADPAARRSALIQQFTGDLSAADENTRRDAVRNLRMLKAVEARQSVLALLADPADNVRIQAAAYFEEIWDAAALEPLAKMMNDKNPVVGELALDALNNSGDERAIKELENYYLRGGNMLLVHEAGKALEENNRKDLIPPGVPRFRDTLRDAVAEQRRFAIRSLRRWGTTDDIPLVRALKEDPDLNVRREVQQALPDWGTE
jgi:HEAT repeat protein